MKRRKGATAKELKVLFNDAAVIRRADLDFFDQGELYELPDHRLLLKITGKNKGLYFDDLADYEAFRAPYLNGSLEPVSILAGYAQAGETLESLAEKAIDLLSGLLELDKSVFNASTKSFKKIDPLLKRLRKTSPSEEQDYSVIHAVISYLTATAVHETGAFFRLVADPQRPGEYCPELSLKGYTFNFVTNVSDAYFEEPGRFCLQYCYDSQPMESL